MLRREFVNHVQRGRRTGKKHQVPVDDRDAFSMADSNYATVIMVITVGVSHQLLIPAIA